MPIPPPSSRHTSTAAGPGTGPVRGTTPIAAALRWLVLLSTAASWSFSAGAAQRTGAQPVGEISDTAKRFIEQRFSRPGRTGRLEISIGVIDRRLRLARCSEALTGFLPYSARRASNLTVGVRCSGGHPWKLFVQARVRDYRAVVVTRRPVLRGERLQPGDLEIVERDVSRMQGRYLQRVEPLLGKQLRRDLARGAVVSRRAVRAVKVVKRGQRVVVLAALGGLEVRVEGLALADAGVGENVKVRNSRSKRIVEGTVTAGGLVRVSM